MTLAAVLLAVALLVSTDRSARRLRTQPAGAAVQTPQRPSADDPLAAASTFELFAACLASGMTVSGAAAATAPSAPEPLAGLLTRSADLLALGADPATAWPNDAGLQDRNAEALLRLARRSASSGTALARGVAELADQARHEAAAAAEAAAERAGVLIAGPLGLCYLPAFLCLGIIPVVAGLVGDVLNSGLW
ncbi:type II secretion system F family protein [Mycobacterium sp. 155]|uniref:type II secretion system F family protein n=1 Tax=Mycobacterium sp. 155 TaxID=1157943 RepID=UPI00036A6111|nr:type II secretion system F family protein [Mycobacterium sp. 155]